jgi:hypothetical protein
MNKNTAFTGNEIDLEKLNNIANKEVFDRNNFEQNRYFSNVKKKTTVQNTGNSKLI